MYYTNRGRIMAVTVQVGAGLTLGTPHELFVTKSTNWASRWSDGFDVTADGQRFIFVDPIQNDADVTPSIVVAQNWSEEFARKH